MSGKRRRESKIAVEKLSTNARSGQIADVAIGPTIRAPISAPRLPRRDLFFRRTIFFHQPNVAVRDRRQVPLQLKRPRPGYSATRPPAVGLAISTSSWMTMPLCLTVRRALSVLFCSRIEAGRGEIDIVGLPPERWKTHVHVRRPQAIDAAAFVALAIESKRIEHLHLIAVLQIDAAVAALLAASPR